MKKAFTLGEMLVCLAVMSVIIAMFLITIHAKPNSNMVMFRKAYNTASNTVYEMLQSAVYYENGLLSNTNKASQKIEGEYPQGTQKFCKIFASYVNTGGEINCKKGGDSPSFSTLDGIDWYLPPKTTKGTFSGSKREIIRVDVNGSTNPPNCNDGAENCKNPDIFDIEVSDIGKLYITGENARKYLQNIRSVSK